MAVDDVPSTNKMKLISNFKDYYDWVIGAKYGIDPKVVYERIPMEVNRHGGKPEKTGLHVPYQLADPNRKDITTFRLHVCGRSYLVLWFEGKFHINEAATALQRRLARENNRQRSRAYYRQVEQWGDELGDKFPTTRQQWYDTPTPLNAEFNCPVILEDTLWRSTLHLNVRLSDYGIPSVLDPETVFLQLTDFFMPKEQVVDKRTDVEKLQSHGFDKKTSFRKM
jgi:hypothetical protein